MDGVAEGVGEEGEEWGDKGNDDADDADETNAARSFVSFSSEKEVEESWPLPLLSYIGDARMERDPNTGGKQDRNEGNKWNGDNNDAKERRVAQFSIPFFSEKGVEEPRLPPLLSPGQKFYFCNPP